MSEAASVLTVMGMPVYEIYTTGVSLSMGFYIVASLLFACWRWIQCFIDFINGGDLVSIESSYHWAEGDMFNYDRHNPIGVTIDMVIHVLYGFVVSVAWVISVPVITIIFIAKSIRKYRMEQKKIMNKLSNSSRY